MLKNTFSTRVPRACVLTWTRNPRTKTVEEPEYLSYLLRLWTVKASGGTLWRASLESPITGDRLGFLDLEALINYLEWITQNPACEKHLPIVTDQE